MNKLITAMTEDSNVSSTRKGAKTLASSLNDCVDLFGSLSAMRASSDSQVISAFSKAFAEDKLTAMRILFHSRDIRGGSGERKVFRTIVKYLAESNTEVLRKNLHLFSEYGRFDDLLVLMGTPLESDVLGLIKKQLDLDLKSKNPSLLAKWLPSRNTSSNHTRKIAWNVLKYLDMTEKQYRKTLSSLREKIKVVERDMCASNWTEIDYQSVPSKASMNYRNAFLRNDETRYRAFLGAVERGEKEIKTGTLYPYDLIRKVYNGQFNKTISLQWDNLPNYVEPFNGLVIYDTSASMRSSNYYGGQGGQVNPIDVALSLAIYIGERNEGVWKNCAIPFSSNARFEKFKGSNIYEKFSNLRRDGWVGSTNLQSAFDLILVTAVENNVSENDMPKTLFVVSDMEFDSACKSNKRSNFEQIKKKYKKAGYEMPQLVFWNVRSYGNNSPVKYDETGTCLVSGCSPAILKTALKGSTPFEVMMETVNSERYLKVTI